jgi:hypothetical protein
MADASSDPAHELNFVKELAVSFPEAAVRRVVEGRFRSLPQFRLESMKILLALGSSDKAAASDAVRALATSAASARKPAIEPFPVTVRVTEHLIIGAGGRARVLTRVLGRFMRASHRCSFELQRRWA